MSGLNINIYNRYTRCYILYLLALDIKKYTVYLEKWNFYMVKVEIGVYKIEISEIVNMWNSMEDV